MLSRYFYTVAMRIAQEKSEETYYAYEYNNICLTYISQGQYENALEYANLAEQWLPQSDGKMNAIVGITTLMEHFMDNPRKMRSYLTKIQSSSKYMVSLINDLLDMSKIESGTVSLNLESVNLSEQIEQVNEIISAQAGDKNLEYCVQTDIQHTNLMADEVRLRQVLLNILTNAVKYTPAKGRIRMDIQELDCAIEGKAQ